MRPPGEGEPGAPDKTAHAGPHVPEAAKSEVKPSPGPRHEDSTRHRWGADEPVTSASAEDVEADASGADAKVSGWVSPDVRAGRGGEHTGRPTTPPAERRDQPSGEPRMIGGQSYGQRETISRQELERRRKAKEARDQKAKPWYRRIPGMPGRKSGK